MSGAQNSAPWREIGRDQRSITLGKDTFQLSIVVCTPSIIRVRMSNAHPLERRSWAVTPADSAWNVCDWQDDSSTTGLLTVQTSHMRVIVDQTLGTVSFADTQNMVFCADAQPATFDEEGVAVNKILASGERFYGFGERTGLL